MQQVLAFNTAPAVQFPLSVGSIKEHLEKSHAQDRGLYPVNETRFASGDSFRTWKFCNEHFVPTYHQWRLYQAVFEAVIEQGLFYNSDIYDFVVGALADILSPELLALNYKNAPTERGAFGMELFYMKDVVTSHQVDALNRKAFAAMMNAGICVGSEIKGPYQRNLSTYSSMEVMALDEVQGSLTLLAKKRGSRNRWHFTVGAMCPKLQACIGINVSSV